MQNLGKRVLEAGADYVAAALEPDLSLSPLVRIESLLLPATSGKWPHLDIEEYLWVVSERIGWAIHCCRGDETQATVSAYFAALMLRFESIVGERAIPRAPDAAAILGAASKTLGDISISQSIIEILSAELAVRQANPAFSFDNVYPLIACRHLVHLQIGRKNYAQSMSLLKQMTIKPLWLWANSRGTPGSTQVIWNELVGCEFSEQMQIVADYERLSSEGIPFDSAK